MTVGLAAERSTEDLSKVLALRLPMTEPFGLLFLVVDVPKVFLECGDFAEPVHAVGFIEPFAGVGLDLQ